MVVIKIGDGMGNQMFNYACGYALARRDGEKLKLDISECDNSSLRDYELDFFKVRYDAKEFEISCHCGKGLVCRG